MLLLLSCQPSPKAISYGEDACWFCKMTIVDPQHGAELVTDKGKVYMFDAIECMVNYLEAYPETQSSFLLVNDYNAPKKLINAETSHYLISKAIPSPMGAYLTAFENEEAAKAVVTEKGGALYNWEDLKIQLKEQGVVSYYDAEE